MTMRPFIIALLSGAVSCMLLSNTAFAQEERPVLVKKRPTQDLSAEQNRDGMQNGLSTICGKADLTMSSSFIVASQSLDTSTKTMTLGFIAVVDNTGNCDANTNRTKAVLTLNGGKWVGQSKDDISIPAGSSTNARFDISFPYAPLLIGCEVSRSDWKLKVTADFRDVINEMSESNNSRSYGFTTTTSKVCPFGSSGGPRIGKTKPKR